MKKELRLGTVLNNRYKLESLISKSGKAHTYKASDIRFPERGWVVKAFEEKPKTNFIDEMKLLVALSHPNLVNVVDYFEEHTLYLAIEEYIDTETLEGRLSRGSRPVERQIVSWGIQCLDALLYLHAHLTHFAAYRDFSPQKVLITGTGQVKILPSFLHLWNEKPAGVIGFTAPELFQEEATPDERCDVFAVGAVMHRAFVGEFNSQIPFVFQPISSENPNLASPIEHILEKATNEDPDKRYPSLAEFRDELIKSLETVFHIHEHGSHRKIPLALEWILIAVIGGLALGKMISKTHFNLGQLFHWMRWR